MSYSSNAQAIIESRQKIKPIMPLILLMAMRSYSSLLRMKKAAETGAEPNKALLSLCLCLKTHLADKQF